MSYGLAAAMTEIAGLSVACLGVALAVIGWATESNWLALVMAALFTATVIAIVPVRRSLKRRRALEREHGYVTYSLFELKGGRPRDTTMESQVGLQPLTAIRGQPRAQIAEQRISSTMPIKGRRAVRLKDQHPREVDGVTITFESDLPPTAKTRPVSCTFEVYSGFAGWEPPIDKVNRKLAKAARRQNYSRVRGVRYERDNGIAFKLTAKGFLANE